MFGVIYRPPSIQDLSGFLNEYEENVSCFLTEYDNLVCVGDLNINLLNLASDGARRFSSILESYELKQLIIDPTRHGHCAPSLLDPLICYDESLVTDSYVEKPEKLHAGRF